MVLSRGAVKVGVVYSIKAIIAISKSALKIGYDDH
jgi:hypothetical protein